MGLVCRTVTMLNLLLWLHLFLSGQSQDISTNKTSEEDRRQKALSIFTVVKFPNTGCQSSTTGRNGTCYTVSECAANVGLAPFLKTLHILHPLIELLEAPAP